jgi:hypothetical protein
MYCPKCAAPIDGVKFCRQCGANVSLVPQALTGQLPPTPTALASQQPTQSQIAHGDFGRRERPAPTVESAAHHLFRGIGFFFVSLACFAFAPAGRIWWFWLLIPAFMSIGNAVGQYLRIQKEETASLPFAEPQTFNNLRQPAALEPPVPTTSELKLPAAAQDLAQPVSVTEHTTALLDPVRQKIADKN